jgi:predicted Zn-dependent peptidase
VSLPRLHRLANGVRVVVDPMPGLESAALSVTLRGGSRWETPETAGWAHLLEHMVFKGAGPRSAKAIVEAIEAEGGQINAATGYERTGFQVRCLTGGLPLAFEVISDLIRRPALDAAELEREKQVVGQEIAEAADTPDDRVFDLAQGQAFAGQPLGRPILGEEASLAPCDVAALSRFHQALYSPDRLVISVAGATDEDEALALTERWFGDARASDSLPEPADASFKGGALAETRKLEQSHRDMDLPGVGARHDDYFAQRLFSEILGGGMASRLFQEVREERGLAYAIDAYAESYEDVGLIGVYAGAAAKDAAPTARLALEIIEALTEGPTETELARAKAQARAGLFMARESPLARADQAAGQLILFDRLFAVSELAEAVEAVSAADVARIGERALSGGKAMAVLGPKAAAEAADVVRRLN